MPAPPCCLESCVSSPLTRTGPKNEWIHDYIPSFFKFILTHINYMISSRIHSQLVMFSWSPSISVSQSHQVKFNHAQKTLACSDLCPRSHITHLACRGLFAGDALLSELLSLLIWFLLCRRLHAFLCCVYVCIQSAQTCQFSHATGMALVHRLRLFCFPEVTEHYSWAMAECGAKRRNDSAPGLRYVFVYFCICSLFT